MTSKQQHYARSAFSDGATKLGISILQTAKQPDKIFQHGRYFGIPGDTKLQKEILKRALATPKIQPYLPTDLHNSQTLADGTMPKGSLGWCVHRRWKALNSLFDHHG